jgi:hypothetical protein
LLNGENVSTLATGQGRPAFMTTEAGLIYWGQCRWHDQCDVKECQ